MATGSASSSPQPLGDFIRAQRQLADLSLREMAAMTEVSNAYLSQIERGLHQPSLRVLRSIAAALQVPFEQFVGATDSRDAKESPHVCSVEAAIGADPRLTQDQKTALASVYRSFVQEHGARR